MDSSPQPALSVVVSVYNEEAVLAAFWAELHGVLEQTGRSYEVVFVDDGSTDRSREIIEGLCTAHPPVRACFFSRNFGHEAAMHAGLAQSRGAAVVSMDADLHHPPSEIPTMLAAFDSGHQIVHMRRLANDDDGLLRRLQNRLFYALLDRLVPYPIEPNATDFFLVSARVAEVLVEELQERTRFVRGFLQMVGFSRVFLDFKAEDRHAGVTKYSFTALVGLAFQAVVVLSNVPLRLGLFVGALSGGFTMLLAVYTLQQFFIDSTVPAGYTTTVLALCIFSSLQFMLLGVMGLYIERIFGEVKQQPIYLVERTLS